MVAFEPVFSLGFGLVCWLLEKLALRWPPLVRDLLSEHFTLLCADEPGLKIALLKEVDDDDV